LPAENASGDRTDDRAWELGEEYAEKCTAGDHGDDRVASSNPFRFFLIASFGEFVGIVHGWPVPVMMKLAQDGLALLYLGFPNVRSVGEEAIEVVEGGVATEKVF
jgi:hypothetical protein